MDSNDCEHEAASVCSSQSFKTARDYEDSLHEQQRQQQQQQQQQDGNSNDLNNVNADQRAATARKNVYSSSQLQFPHMQQRPTTVTHPTVNNLSINSDVDDKVAIPFKTIPTREASSTIHKPTPTLESAELPEHLKMSRGYLNRDQQESTQATINLIRSRSAVFGFAQTEERVLQDGHVTMIPDHGAGVHASTASSSPLSSSSSSSSTASLLSQSSSTETCPKRQSISSSTSNGSETDHGCLSSVPDSGNGCINNAKVNPLMGNPYARTGISPALNLHEQYRPEVDSHQPVEDSLESLYESKDWGATRLGPRSEWPPELSHWIQVMLKSAAALALYWGDQSCLLYNNAWKPILKHLHPYALGTPGPMLLGEEAWAPVGERVARIMKEGCGSIDKGLRMDLQRGGYEEECYFDFSLTPVFLKDGSIGGVLAIVQETTQTIINERRLKTLNEFSKQMPTIHSVAGAYSMITNILQESNNLDVPFSIIYKTEELSKEPGQPGPYEAYSPRPSNGNALMSPPSHNDLFAANPDADKKDSRRAPQTAILCSTSFDRNLDVINYGDVNEAVFSKATSTRHIPDILLITPEEYEPFDPSEAVSGDPWAWPVRSVLADGIPRLVTLPKSTHKLARALLLPIFENPSVLESRIAAILIVGINPFQLLDNEYLNFLTLLAANIASVLHFGHSREEERKRTEALMELNNAKISFFQNISHELRTPLTLMLSPLEDVLNQTPENAPTRQNLEMVRRNSRRLLKLVNTLLQFSRIEAGKGHAIFEETDLEKATCEVSANFDSVARGFNLKYNVNCESLENIPGGIWVDRAMWVGIVLNLIGNAFKHTWVGSITVHQYPSLGKDGRQGVALDVSDTGVGIAAEHLHTLFGRFNRVENKQSRSHEGTGIGLSLVKELVEVHGGEVSVTSEVDKGTCFHLWIPAGKDHHPSSQVKLEGSDEADSVRASVRSDDVMNNKTDASMYVEEAAQWIAHKSLPGSTLTASGTDSTEEEKIEEDDGVHIGPNYLYDRQETIQMNTDFEISTMDLEEDELTKILLDAPASEDLVLPVDSLSGDNNTNRSCRSCLESQSPRLPVVEISTVAHLEQLSSSKSPDAMFESTIDNDEDGCDDEDEDEDDNYGGQVRTEEVIQEPEEAVSLLPRAQPPKSYIIIVDDNNDMRAYLKDILGKDFRVRCAVDGVDAIRLINDRHRQGKRIDLILSDVAMPNMNGYELLKQLRNDPATMMTPIILLSARAGEEANVEGLDLGADDCLVKPFSARELLARVRSTIRLSDLRHELIREQRHALEMKQLIYSISVRIRSGLSFPQILDTASRELFKVIRCNAIRICRFRRVDEETGQHWIRFVSEIVRIGKPKVMTSRDRLLPRGLEVSEASAAASDHDCSSDLRHVRNYQHPIFGAKSFMSVALIYNRKIWGYLMASRDADMVDWSQSEKLLFEQTGNQISLAIAHASLWELKKSQQVEMEAAHAANEAKSQILANTSHELRTPIGAIVGALSALEDTDYNLTSEQRDMVKIMQITSDVALSVINDLLDTAKLEAGAMSLNVKGCPGLIETLSQSVRIFADKSGSKEVDLIMEPSEDLQKLDAILEQGSVVWTDGDRLQQVIMNLIGNAVKFTAAGKVVISCSISNSSGKTPLLNSGNDSTFSDGSHSVHSTHQETLLQQEGQIPRMAHMANLPTDVPVSYSVFRLEVSDTGIGIDPDFLKNHIFKSFAQHDQTMTRRFGGTGLGLAISKHLVMMNGGILGVTSNVGQGSTFYFTWPFAVVGPSHQHQNAMPLPRTLSSKISLTPNVASETRVVVVESVPESRNVFRWVLEEQNVRFNLYENCDNILQDERSRPLDLLGPDGSVLVANYRPNAHYFFCVRTSNVETIVETARKLGMLFKQRNDEAKSREGNENYKDQILSVVLVVFSSLQGRHLAKDMTRRICDGLEDTVECRHILKPVKPDRVVECLQMVGSHAPFTRGFTGSLQGPHQHPYYQRQLERLQGYDSVQQWRTTHTSSLEDELPTRFHHDNSSADSAHESNVLQSQVISANNTVGLATSDYERDNDSNKNTSELSYLDLGGNYVANACAQAMVSRDDDGSGGDDGISANMSEKPSEHQPNAAVPSIESQQQHHPRRPSLAMQRRLRMKSISGSSGAGGGRAKPVGQGGPSVEDSPKSSSDNPAFSNRAARAAAGKRERKGKCILCVEDNIINLRVVQYQLQKLGYDTQSACDGQVAVDTIKAQAQMLNQEMESSSMIENGTSMNDGDSQSQHTAGSSSHHWNIRNGLLMVPGSNENTSDSFGGGEVNSIGIMSMPVPVTETALPSNPSGVSALSLGSSSISSAESSPTLSAVSIDGTITTDFAPSAAHVGNASVGHQPIAAPLRSNVASPAPSSSKQRRHPDKIDLILMDCAMPIKSGFDAASEIRAMGESSSFAANIPIIALTASAVASTKEKCIASGMNGYLSKPTKLADLEAMLNKWIKD
ncbi:hypothetical protein BGZ80_011016 [Entomortierella chlamydospora]|uniref:histidine kinase n=1 Tax=Entomortierella chlamydospora TaxID=101097 RepID=A0A9P6MV31_9FUNG|nr:hypothetical protein BGZ80_011016 [Entomortierella chlamydospora]